MIQSPTQYPEELAQVHVVGRLLESQAAAIVQVHRELRGESLAERLHRCRHLLLADLIVLLFLVPRLQTLPRERSAQEVHEDVPERLHVVAAALLNAQMRIDAGVPRRARQALVLPVRDVRPRPAVAVLLRQPEVDDEDLVAVLPDAHQEVVGFHVAVDEVLVVDVLDARYHLVGEHQDRLLGELAPAEVEQVLETGAEQLHHENVVVALVRPEPLDAGHADTAGQDTVDLQKERH